MSGISSKALYASGNTPDCGCGNKKGSNGNEDKKMILVIVVGWEYIILMRELTIHKLEDLYI